MIDTDKYEGHTPAPWMMGEYKGRPSIHAGNEKFVRSIARGLNPSQTTDHKLIADAPLLLAEVKRLHHAVLFLSAKIFLNENGIPYNYERLMEYCFRHCGEPDDMSGELGQAVVELEEALAYEGSDEE